MSLDSCRIPSISDLILLITDLIYQTLNHLYECVHTIFDKIVLRKQDFMVK